MITKEKNLTPEEKKIITAKLSHEIEKQLENSLRSTAQYIKDTFLSELINDKKR